MTNEVVHVLDEGLPLCGFSLDVPKDWPAGHKWVYLVDVRDATCKNCRERADFVKLCGVLSK